MTEKILWYVMDPMCSWCWGFSPVIEAIRDTYQHRLRIELLPGGLRPGTTQPMPPGQRSEILRHWHAVHDRTGQPFRFDGAMPEGFVYDTEPASRAIVALAMMMPGSVFAFLACIQEAFYVRQEEVTRPDVLAALAVSMGADRHDFLQLFESDRAKQQTLTHFRQAREWGVHSFPTVILQDGSDHLLLSSGYCPVETLCSRLDIHVPA